MIHIRQTLLLLPLVLACAPRSARVDPPLQAYVVPTEEPIALQTATGTLHGTALLPRGTGPWPVALIIAGSGPTDRDGNSPMLPGRNNSLKLLAEGLAERGIATVRYDKRGVAQSVAAGAQEVELRFNMYVDDAAAWIARLRSDPRYSSVSVIGHSEGSLIGIIAAQRSDVDAVVSIAGAGRPAVALLRDQLRPQLPPNLWDESERILDSLMAGRTVSQVSPSLNVLYRPSVQPYLISWLGLDPAAEIARIGVPVLIVQGSTDVQVGVADARLLHAAHPGAEELIVEGMNHVLKLVPADLAEQQASYSNPDLPVAVELITRVSAFVRAAGAR